MAETLRFLRFPNRINHPEWFVLSAAMHEESTILNTRTSPENLAKVFEDGLALVLERDDEMIGFIAAWPVASGFVELGSAWIRIDCRNQGYGNLLYEQSKSLPGVSEKVVFAVTQNPMALKAGRHAGLMPHTDWTNPIPFKHTCGPCDKWETDEEKRACPLRDKTCWLRYVRQT